MELIIIILLVLLNGIFAMSELSLVSSRRYKLENAAQKGNKAAKTALTLADNPTKFLSTVQIGITLIGILLGVYSGDSIAKDVTTFISKIDFLRAYASQIGTGISVLFITYLSIVLGELFPKRIGLTFPEPVALLIARPMNFLSQVTSPFVWLLTISNNILLNIFGIQKNGDNRITEDEIKAIIKESTEGGEIQEIEQDIVERVFELGDKKVNSLYTHRNDLVYFDMSDNWERIRQKINQEKHSAYPVCENNNLDNILGIVLLKDLFDDRNTPFSLKNVLKQPLFLNESSSAYKVLEQFKTKMMHYGIIVDEYGTTVGMVTMDDIMDAIIGNATELDQTEYSITQRDHNSWLIDGYYNLDEFRKYFGITIEEKILVQFTTVSGLFMYYTHNVPEVGDKISLQEYILEIVDKDGQRIDKILITKQVS